MAILAKTQKRHEGKSERGWAATASPSWERGLIYAILRAIRGRVDANMHHLRCMWKSGISWPHPTGVSKDTCIPRGTTQQSCQACSHYRYKEEVECVGWTSHSYHRGPDLVLHKPSKPAFVTDASAVADNADLQDAHLRKCHNYNSSDIQQRVTGMFPGADTVQ